MNCSTVEPIVGCWNKAGGSTETVVIHYEYATAANGNKIIKATRYTRANGADIITVPVGDTITVGACPVIATTVDVLAGSLGTIAGPTRAATAEFTGAPNTVNTAGLIGKLQSLTVTASGVVDGTNTSDNIVVALPSGTSLRLFNGQSFTWSVVRGQDDELAKPISITASGNAYANVAYTVI